jgi:hypothetical protein
MEDFVSNRWIRVAGLVASMSIVWGIFIRYGFPWMGLVWVSLAFSGALWLRMRSPRSIAQVIDDVEAEPVRAVAAPGPVVVPATKAVL